MELLSSLKVGDILHVRLHGVPYLNGLDLTSDYRLRVHEVRKNGEVVLGRDITLPNPYICIVLVIPAD